MHSLSLETRKRLVQSDGHPLSPSLSLSLSLSTGRIVSLRNTVENISALSFQLHFVTYVLLSRHEMQLLSLYVCEEPNGISALAIPPVSIHRHIFLCEFLPSMNSHKLLTNAIANTASFFMSTEKKTCLPRVNVPFLSIGQNKSHSVVNCISWQRASLSCFTLMSHECSSLAIIFLLASESSKIIKAVNNIQAVHFTGAKLSAQAEKLNQIACPSVEWTFRLQPWEINFSWIRSFFSTLLSSLAFLSPSSDGDCLIGMSHNDLSFKMRHN